LKTELKIACSFPYPLNQKDEREIELDGEKFKIKWNGVVAEVLPAKQSPKSSEKARKIAEILNSIVEVSKKIDFVPLKRGFSKPLYSVVSIEKFQTEDEIATFLANNQWIVRETSNYLEMIANRDLHVHVKPGTSLFSLITTEKPLGTSADIVNDGFGINQLVWLLTKSLHEDANMICIGEPEIHLHPKAIRRLAHALAKIAKDKNKNFLISTHSESFLLAFLSLVSRKELKPQEITIFFAEKREKKKHYLNLRRYLRMGKLKEALDPLLRMNLKILKNFLK